MFEIFIYVFSVRYLIETSMIYKCWIKIQNETDILNTYLNIVRH